MNLSGYLKKSISTGLANTIFSALSTLFFLPLIIGSIGIEKYGVWAMLAIFTSASGLVDMGVSKSLVYFIPKEKSQEGVNKIYSAGLLINGGVLAVLLTISALIFVVGVDPWEGVSGVPEGIGSVVTFSGLIILALSLVTSLYRALLESLFKIHVVNIGFLLQTFLYYVFAYITSLLTDDLSWLIGVSASVYGVIFTYHLWCVRRYSSVSFVPPGLSTIKKVMGYSFKSLSISLIHMVVQPLTRFFFVRAADDSSVYGLFDIAMRLSLMAYSLLAALSVPLLSLFSSYGKDGASSIDRILGKIFWVSAILYVFGIGVFVLTGRFLLDLVFHLDSVELYYACLILMIGMGAAGVAEGFTRAFMALGKLRLLFAVRLLLPATNFALILILPSWYVLTRYSVAYSAAFLIMSLATVLAYWLSSPKWSSG